jgi:hypothetical protein
MTAGGLAALAAYDDDDDCDMMMINKLLVHLINKLNMSSRRAPSSCLRVHVPSVQLPPLT